MRWKLAAPPSGDLEGLGAYDEDSIGAGAKFYEAKAHLAEEEETGETDVGLRVR